MIIYTLFTCNWGSNSDILQTICAVIAVPITLITIYKLMSRDKEREKEIEKITQIAEKLTDLVSQQKQEDKNYRRPIIGVTLELINQNKIKFHFTNFNVNSLIKSIKIDYDKDEMNQDFMSSTINSVKGNQMFYTEFKYKERLELHNFLMIYITEEGYKYKQEIMIFKNDSISVSSVFDSEKLEKDYR